MDKSKTLLVVVIAIMAGGCGQMGSSPEEEPEKTPAEMDPADLPQIDAFQNEYSREMMVSTEPVADGYYLMRKNWRLYDMVSRRGRVYGQCVWY
ncbi:hypothetical protein [Shouchella clausii]|uniref:Uncharacterized protein n=1 Tax=Shouchella clausii TaxID=79880 RepID=A0A268NVI6_SHOCL|nr:hypothetical protein [Shouchella clausii]PAE87496.1 hypothetical protein CHH72_17400 [Shouchella clausii]